MMTSMRALISLALILMLPMAAARAAEAVIDDFEKSVSNWSANSGAVKAAKDKTSTPPSTALRWKYTLGNDFMFVSSGENMQRFAGADSIAFRARSDRKGRIFVRIDLDNKAAFVKDIVVDKPWTEVRLKFKDFKRAGIGIGKLDAKKIKTIYFVDLTGKDEGAKGNRTLWVDDVRAVGAKLEATAAVALAAAAKPAKDTASDVDAGLVLRAYDGQGKLVSLEQLKSYGVSGGSYAFLTDLDGYPRPGTLESSARGDSGMPVLNAALNDTVVINVLFWPIPAFGKMWVEADNGGKGYQLASGTPKLELNLNFELAKSRLAKIERLMAASRQRVPALAALQPRIAKIQGQLKDADAAADEVARARIADEAFAAGMALGEEMALLVADADTKLNRTGRADVAVTTAAGAPLADATVEFTQESNDFMFGLVQSLGYIEHKIKPETYERVATLMHDAGFNTLTTTLFWNHVETKKGKRDFNDWDQTLGLKYFYDQGFKFQGHGVLHAWLPEYVKDEGKSKFAANVVNNFSETLPRYEQTYPGAYKIWQAVNEAGSNRFVDLSMNEKVDVMKKISATIRKVSPQSRIWVNEVDWDRAQRFWPNADAHLKDLRSPLEFFEFLNQAKLDYDIAGIEWYPGLKVSYKGILNLSEPMVDLLRTMEVFDRFQRLNKPLHIAEFAVPGSSEPEWLNGYRGTNWTLQSQAEFATQFYRIAFSRPHIHQVTYWSINDDEPWAPRGGLLDTNYKPKPIFDGLKDLLGGWRSRGQVKTDSRGHASFQGYAGDYAVKVTSGTVVTPAKLHIDERGTASLTIKSGAP